MRKKNYILLLAIFILTLAKQSIAQDFLGLSTGNYAGVTGVMLQPASIVDSRFKFDINLFSTSLNFSNNYLLVNRDAILKFNKNNFGNYATFKQNYLTQASLAAGDKAFFNINNRTQVPLSFMATTGKKSAIALNIQSRSMVQGRDIPQDLASVAYGNFFPAANSGFINASGFKMLSLNWVEVGLTYGRVLYSNNKHFLKAAFTAKYLGGISSLALSSDDLRFGINRDSTFNFNTSNTQFNHNQNADFNNIFDKNFSPDASSFGFDAGIVYEFRGNIDKFKYISRDDEKSYEKERRDVNKYMFRLGVSLLDAGKFSFNKPPSVNSFSGNINSWDIRNEHFNDLTQFDTALARRTTALPNDPRSYTVYLPTALSIQLDIRFIKGFYLNFMSYTPVTLGSGSGNAGFHFNNYDYYTITPRWESRNLGIYIPYTFGNHQQLDNYKENLLGATVRLGPLFIGSSNLGTMAFNKNLKAADVHVGFKIGFTYGKPNKASMFLDKITTKRNNVKDKNDTIYNDNSAYNGHINKNKRDTTYKANQPKKPTPLIIDYKNGQIYSDGNHNGSIVIVNNNNFYYGNNTTPNKDSVTTYNYITQVNDSAYQKRDSIKYNAMQKAMNDSLNGKKVKLDSLIRNMQDLRKRMDSTSARNLNDSIKRTSLLKTKDTSITTTTARLNNNNNSQIINRTKADTTIKINSTATTKYITEKDKNYNNSNDPSLLNNQQQQYLPNQKEGIVNYNGAYPYNSTNESEYKKQQDRDYNRFIDQSNQLQREINDLQTEIVRQRRNSKSSNTTYYPNNYRSSYPSNYASNYPAILPVPVNNNKANTVYIRDTIYLKDTTHNYNNSPLAKTIYQQDTVFKSIPSIPVLNNVTIKPEISYVNQPSDFVLFAINKSTIQPIYNDRLNYISNILKTQPNLFGLITGHTDATGPLKINEALSLKRAETVRSYLMNKGVKPEQLILNTTTDNQINKDDNNKNSNADNRRTDIKISDKKF